MIFPVYHTELALPEGYDPTRESWVYQNDTLLRRFHGESYSKVVGHIAVGAMDGLYGSLYESREMPERPDIDRVYQLLSDTMHVWHVSEETESKLQPEENDELPLVLKAHGLFNDIDVSIAGLYYRSNTRVGSVNIIPRQALYKSISDEKQLKMLGIDTVR